MSTERRKQFPFDEFEPRWQAEWELKKAFRAPNPGEADFDPTKPKYFVLDMFPYPSGNGLHVGHPEGYTATDIIGRFKKMNGFNVLHPMGWDAFGLPAEQYAIKTGQHPRITTERNVANFTAQLKRLGFAYDWDREVNTTDPGYFKWTQWIFLKLYGSYVNEQGKARPITELEAQGLSRDEIDARRLAYVSEAPVNWCPALGTVLANEEVIDGKSEVGGHPVERKPMRQWMLRITSFAQRLIDDLEDLDWPESIKLHQRNWIGRSEGAEVTFDLSGHAVTVFTTRPDTLFGATYMVLSPEHPLLSQVVSAEQRAAVEAYQKAVASKSDLERTELAKEKTGVFTGAYATNPVNGEKIPVWIADYVLMSYGTGAIMAVPAHDERDFEFAEKFGLPVVQVVKPTGEQDWRGYTEDGTAINSGFLDGIPTAEAKRKIAAWLQEKSLGRTKVNYKLRDWLFSRQRYWGEPFPILWTKEDGLHHALPEDQLPLLPPDLDDFKPTGTAEPPLSKATAWVNFSDKATRELNTMPQWAGSCWYYLRYCDAQNSERFVGKEAEAYWMGRWRNGTGDALYDEATWQQLADAITERALEEKTKRPPFVLAYAKVSARFAELGSQASGESLQHFTHTIDVYSVRHCFKQHGNAVTEAKRGQEAISEEDIYLLPEVLSAPDSVEFVAPSPGGLKRFVSQKRINGHIFVVEELRGKRAHLNLVTFYKTKAAAGDVTPKAPLPSTSNNDRQPELKEKASEFKPGGVDLYVGGTEHAVLHLLYARFWHKALFDLGYVSTPEPFQRLVNQGLILGEDGQKMSKSRGNVVNPDDVVAEYGADALRLYEMFMGPLEQVKPWSMKGVEGVYRFLARVWRLVMVENQEGQWVVSPALQDVQADKKLTKVLHETIKKCGEDIEKLSFNTAISAMMVLTNAITACEQKPVAAVATFLKVLSPFAPHLAEELNGILQKAFPAHSAAGFVSDETWPKYDPAALVDDELEIVFQVNGKLRDRVTVPAGISKEEVEKLALASARVQEFTTGVTVRKVIYVPGKLVNIVAN